MRLSELLYSAGVIRGIGYPEMEIRSVASDSRRAEKDSLFIAHEGSKRNGRDYISDAIARGATAVITSYPPPKRDDAVIIPVESTRRAESEIWNAFYGNPARSLKTVLVTGTNGKTTVSTMLFRLLRAAGKNVGLITTVRICCNELELTTDGAETTDIPAAMTTPDPRYLYGLLAKMKALGAEYAVIEASSHSIAQLKLAPIKAELAVFTNLSPEHLDFHGTLENYFAAKSALFDMCRIGVINTDDNHGARLPSLKPNCEYVRCSARSSEADASAESITFTEGSGISYIYEAKNIRFSLSLPMMGEFNVMNSLLAVTAALKLGVEIEVIKDAMSCFSGISGRMERISLDAPFTVIIDYAHTPTALENLLLAVSFIRSSGGHILLVFGCGGDRDPSKRKPMAQIASRLADLVIITSDNPRSEDPMSIINDILRGIDTEKPHKVIPDRREAIRYAVANAEKNDLVILAGKGHESYEITKDGKRPFDEAQIVREALQEIQSSDK